MKLMDRKDRKTRMTGAPVCRLLLALAVIVILGAAFAVPLASASTGHTFDGAFGGPGMGNGLFGNPPDRPAGVGVLPTSGDVVIADRGTTTEGAPNPGIQRFDGSGAFVSSFTLDSLGSAYSEALAVAVDPSGSGAVYVLGINAAGSGGDVLKFDSNGVFEYKLDEAGSGTTFSTPDGGPAALAVDPVDQTVYVSATDANGLPVIDRFDGSTGAFLDSFDGSSGSPDGGFLCVPISLAVDSAQQVYVLDPCKNRVDRYDASGAFVATVDDGSHGAPKAVAVDPVSGEVYVAEAGAAGVFGLAAPHVTRFGASGGAATSTIDLGAPFGLNGYLNVVGMAVSGAGTVYVADTSASKVARFVKFDGPTVTTGASAVQSAQEATIEGTIDPEGVASSYHFEYGVDHADGSGSYESQTGSVPVGSGGPVAVSAALTGLKPHKTYHYRLVDSSASGSIYGVGDTFTTAEAPAAVVGTAFASAIGPRSARLHGTANANSTLAGIGAIYSLEYGTTTVYGQSVGGELCLFSECLTGEDLPMAVPLSGLSPDTTYHFRFVANNGFGSPQAGADQTFITAPAAGAGATGVTSTHAALSGTINPHGVQTSYHFNYGQTSAYGASTPDVDAGAGDGDQRVSIPVSGLLPDSTYHVQVVAVSENGVTRYGADGLFRTAPAPSAVAIAPVGVSATTATLTGELNTSGLPGSYHFDISSPDGSYRTSTPERAAAGNTGSERVSVPIEGLAAGESFVVRLVVTSNDSTTYSDPVTFATPALPRAFPIVVASAIAGAANTIVSAIAGEPDNSFSIAKTSVSGSVATMSIRVPGPGRLETSGARIRPATAVVAKTGAVRVQITLTRTATNVLKRAKSRSLEVKVTVRFTPTGGKQAGRTLTVTFTRKAGR